MIILALTLLAVVIGDLTIKLLLHRTLGTGAISLGRIGRLKLVDGRLWLRRLSERSSRLMLWGIWTVAALALLAVSHWMSLSPFLAGLLLGGSLSNAVETAQRGTVSDYVCLKFWPAFNFADLAVAIGATGLIVELAVLVGSKS